MVSVRGFYSDNPSSNPAEDYFFFCERKENKQKETEVGSFL